MVTRIHIGGFDLDFNDQGRRYRVYAVPEADAVVVSRIFPDPEHGRDIAGASLLDSQRPRFNLPSNWNEDQSNIAADRILIAYLDWKLRNVSRKWDGPIDAQ